MENTLKHSILPMLVLIVLVSGCAASSITPVLPTPLGVPPVLTQGDSAKGALLHWQGQVESGESAGATVFNWFLDTATMDGDLCRQVYVTSFGQVVAEKIKCHPQGDVPQVSIDGWLTTAELKGLDEWLYSRGTFQDGDNYFNGEGSGEVSAGDQAAMKAWAETVYERLLP